ncbi:hypothetical protein KSS87_017656 [Heliosperma pusillum]|nr:hypothetical protein KSS87_017656 [Heliosperma pusillum]
MSEVRLVRCPKCDKVLPEPCGYTVYQCGGCGAILRAKKNKSLAVDNFLNGAVENKSVSSSSSSCDIETSVKKGDLDMALKSPARPIMTGGYNGSKSPLRDNGLPTSPMTGGYNGSKSPLRDNGLPTSPMTRGYNGSNSPLRDNGLPKSPMTGDSNGSKSPLRDNGLPKSPVTGGYNGSKSPLRDNGLPKSPMRDTFLDDLVKISAPLRDASRSPMRERGADFDDFDHDGSRPPARSRHVSKSPVRGRGETVASVRTIYGSRSPISDGRGGFATVGKSPARPSIGDAHKSPLRQGLGSEVEGNVGQDRLQKMTAKTSFSTWLPDDSHEGQSGDNYINAQRRTWRDRDEERPEQIGEGVESVLSDGHGTTSRGSLGDPTHGIDSHSEGDMYKTERFRSDYVGGYARPNVFDGPSEDCSGSNYDYGGPRRSVESARAQELLLERVELLRKCEELKDQLSGLGDAGVSLPGFYDKRDGFPLAEFPRQKRRSMQQFPPDRNMQRPSHFSYGPVLAHTREDMYEYDDRSSGQMKMGTRSNQYRSNHLIHGYVPGRSLDFDQFGFKSHVNDTHGHHPACGCILCYRKDRHDNLRADLISSYSMEHERHGPRGYDPRMAHTAPRGRSPQPQLHHHPKRGNIANLNKRLCRPISGGAPFVLCINCFQLLKLPRNFTAKYKNQKLQCGACSTVTSVDLQLKSLDSLNSEKKPDFVTDSGGRSTEVTNQSSPSPKHRRGRTPTTTTIGSYDFDKISEASKSSKGHKLNFSLPEVAITADDYLSDNESVGSCQHNSSEKPMKIRPLPGSSLLEHLDYSSQFIISQDAEKHIIGNNASPVGPLGVHDAIKTEVTSVLPSSRSQDSEGIAKNSSIDTSKEPSILGSPRKAEVYVNGQGISQRAVKKAEKLAGKIHPGQYWYDPKAGFWGVMGHRCLGIIPPSIKEFSVPMPENCSRGDSTVYVNGRELLKTDLDLIARRGLPTSTDKRYVVDISGRVLDEETRDFVVNLGRLAPSFTYNVNRV